MLTKALTHLLKQNDMKILLICVILILIIPAMLFLWDYYVRLKQHRLIRRKYRTMEVLLEKLESKDTISEQETTVIAQSPSLRLALFHTLKIFHREDLFPMTFYSEEKGAESYLVNWLEFPTELGRAPDEILLLKIVTLELQIRIHYYVFKFRTTAPLWAKTLGWMLGVCGPYDSNSMPFDRPGRIFSRFNPVDLTSPEAEVRWTHDNSVTMKPG